MNIPEKYSELEPLLKDFENKISDIGGINIYHEVNVHKTSDYGMTLDVSISFKVKVQTTKTNN